VRCFRDEDLRADRQPEFTQIDMEMSFVGEEDLMAISEGMMAYVFNEVLGRSRQLPQPFPRLTYAEAIDRYGLDKPDTRFGLELKDVSDIVEGSGFKVFASVVKKGGIVKALNAKGCIDFSRKEIDDLTDFVAVYRAKGLAWIKVREDGWQSPIAKFFTEEEKSRLAERIDMQPGDLVFFVADQPKVTNEALGHLRNHLGKRLDLIDDNRVQLRLGHPLSHVRIRRSGKTLPGPAPSVHRAPGGGLRPPENRPLWPFAPGPTTWSSTALKSAAAASVSTTWTCRQRIFAILGMEPAVYREKFGFCWTPWNPVLRPTGASPSASTAW
jgi:aspartyl-tRNA synthetase